MKLSCPRFPLDTSFHTDSASESIFQLSGDIVVSVSNRFQFQLMSLSLVVISFIVIMSPCNPTGCCYRLNCPLLLNVLK